MGESLDSSEAGFLRWHAVRAVALRRKAYLLTGSWQDADDLLQDALIAVYTAWPRVVRTANPEAYVSRIMVNTHLNDRRRPWRRERPMDAVPDRADERAAAAYRDVEEHDSALSQVLAELPAAQRVVLVLRFHDDLSVDEIARQLDLPAGTVKSRLSRGTVALRRRLGPDSGRAGERPLAPIAARPEELP